MYDIACQSLHAPVIGIQNIRSSISGTFNVSESLILDTIDGPITSTITLASDTQSPNLILDTGNSPINAAISLSSANSNAGSPLPIFTGSVKTFSAPINLAIEAPEGLPLRLFAANNGAPTNISLDSSYQGAFDLQTKLAPVSVNGPSQAITYTMQSYERITGWIGNPPSSSRTGTCGQVVVASALGPISLNIVP
ncbi:hypothetical protein AX14_003945 [Amanita brunnescens Koide BX004]|nr:hypothetical protein AX14_003945 [Amanita brunnescens Koide BX004]